MEKFRKFADPATGINPFVNLSVTKKRTFVDNLKLYV